MDPEKLKKKYKWIGLGLSAVVVFGLLAPFILKAIGGLVGAVVFAVVGSLVIALTPWFVMKLQNWRLKAIKHEARTNPIETQEQILLERFAAWNTMEKKVRDYKALVDNFKIKARRFAEKYPNKAGEYEEQYQKMMHLYHIRRDRLKAAADTLNLMRDSIEEQKARYEMALEAMKVEQASDAIDGDVIMDELKIKEAMNSVDQQVARAFAALDEVATLDSSGRLNYDVERGAKMVLPDNIRNEVHL